MRSYAKWFGVDLGCALKELRMLGVEIDARYAEQLVTTLRLRSRRDDTPPPPTPDLGTYGEDWEVDFAFIAGFTSGGAPFGVSWEEAWWLDDEEPGARSPRQ